MSQLNKIVIEGINPVASPLRLPSWFEEVLSSPAFVMFICGPRDSGKTNKGLRFAEHCYLKYGVRHIATNIYTESYMIEQQVTNYPDLQNYLKKKGRKLFILDELGKAMGKMDFMTRLSKEILKVVELVYHFDCGLIGIAPSEKVVNNTFLDNDLLDLEIISERNRTSAKAIDFIHKRSITLLNINRTSIPYNRRDIAKFTLEKEAFLENQERVCCQIAMMRARGMTYDQICVHFGYKSRNSVREKIIEHCKHTVMIDSKSS